MDAITRGCKIGGEMSVDQVKILAYGTVTLHYMLLREPHTQTVSQLTCESSDLIFTQREMAEMFGKGNERKRKRNKGLGFKRRPTFGLNMARLSHNNPDKIQTQLKLNSQPIPDPARAKQSNRVNRDRRIKSQISPFEKAAESD